MWRYALARFIQGLFVLWIVVTVVFLLSRASGDIASIVAPPDASPEAVEEIRRNLGLDRPLVVQYFGYIGNVVQGDLGDSFAYRSPVFEIILSALPRTLQLGVVSFIFATVTGVAIGVGSALRAGRSFDLFGKGVALLGQSVPSFWLGIVLVATFAVNLRWLPAFGSDSWKHIVLPAIALGAFPLASIARLTRSAVIEILGKDFTLFQRSKGVHPVVLLLHIMRNASLPIVTLAGIQLGALLSSTVVIETLFAWPGVGTLAIQGINSRDYNIVQGVVLVNTAVFVVLLFLVDLSYGLLDPRVRSVRKGAKNG